MPLKKAELKQILDMLLDFKGEKIREYCQNKLNHGFPPYSVLKDLSRGLDEIGKGYEDREFRRYFTSDLIVSGRNMKKAVEMVEPYINKTMMGSKGVVVVGTVRGDVHDIGKKIFSVMLESNGFEVIDLGVDVKKESFTGKVRECKPDILGVSALLVSTVSYMEEIIEELRKEKLRNKVKIILGGRAVTEEFTKKIGADAYGKDAIDGLKKCIILMENPH